jgi:hypothetical protein
MAKKPYEKPAIIQTQAIELRAVTCTAGDGTCQASGGPINS